MEGLRGVSHEDHSHCNHPHNPNPLEVQQPPLGLPGPKMYLRGLLWDHHRGEEGYLLKDEGWVLWAAAEESLHHHHHRVTQAEVSEQALLAVPPRHLIPHLILLWKKMVLLPHCLRENTNRHLHCLIELTRTILYLPLPHRYHL